MTMYAMQEIKVYEMRVSELGLRTFVLDVRVSSPWLQAVSTWTILPVVLFYQYLYYFTGSSVLSVLVLFYQLYCFTSTCTILPVPLFYQYLNYFTGCTVLPVLVLFYQLHCFTSLPVVLFYQYLSNTYNTKLFVYPCNTYMSLVAQKFLLDFSAFPSFSRELMIASLDTKWLLHANDPMKPNELYSIRRRPLKCSVSMGTAEVPPHPRRGGVTRVGCVRKMGGMEMDGWTDDGSDGNDGLESISIGFRRWNVWKIDIGSNCLI